MFSSVRVPAVHFQNTEGGKRVYAQTANNSRTSTHSRFHHSLFITGNTQCSEHYHHTAALSSFAIRHSNSHSKSHLPQDQLLPVPNSMSFPINKSPNLPPDMSLWKWLQECCHLQLAKIIGLFYLCSNKEGKNMKPPKRCHLVPIHYFHKK